MLILAKSHKGHEYMYVAESARQVGKAGAVAIRDALNESQYHLKEGYVWWLHEVDQYDNAYYYAQGRTFRRRKGKVIDSWKGRWYGLPEIGK